MNEKNIFQRDNDHALRFPGGVVARRAVDNPGELYYVFLSLHAAVPIGDFFRTRNGFEAMAHCDWDRTVRSHYHSPDKAVEHIIKRHSANA